MELRYTDLPRPSGLCSPCLPFLTHIEFPSSRRKPLRNTNPLESTFATTVTLSTPVTQEAGSRAAGLMLMFKLLEALCNAPGANSMFTASPRSSVWGLSSPMGSLGRTNGVTIREEL